MLTCREITDLVTDYVERKLSFGDRMRFLMHISMCKNCRRYVRQMKVTAKTLGYVKLDPPSPEVREALMHHFRNWKTDVPASAVKSEEVP